MGGHPANSQGAFISRPFQTLETTLVESNWFGLARYCPSRSYSRPPLAKVTTSATCIERAAFALVAAHARVPWYIHATCFEAYSSAIINAKDPQAHRIATLTLGTATARSHAKTQKGKAGGGLWRPRQLKMQSGVHGSEFDDSQGVR